MQTGSELYSLSKTIFEECSRCSRTMKTLTDFWTLLGSIITWSKSSDGNPSKHICCFENASFTAWNCQTSFRHFSATTPRHGHPWFLRCSSGCLSKGGDRCNFLRAHKAWLANVFFQHSSGLNIWLLRILRFWLEERGWLWKVEINIRRQIMDSWADSLALKRHFIHRRRSLWTCTLLFFVPVTLFYHRQFTFISQSRHWLHVPVSLRTRCADIDTRWDFRQARGRIVINSMVAMTVLGWKTQIYLTQAPVCHSTVALAEADKISRIFPPVPIFAKSLDEAARHLCRCYRTMKQNELRIPEYFL